MPRPVLPVQDRTRTLARLAKVETIRTRVTARQPEEVRHRLVDRLRTLPASGHVTLDRDEAIDLLLSAQRLRGRSRGPDRLLLRAIRQGDGNTVQFGRDIVAHLQAAVVEEDDRPFKDKFSNRTYR